MKSFNISYLLKFFSPFYLLLIVFSPTLSLYSQNIIEINSIKKHIQILASDSLEGRGTGSKGEILTSNYIASEFEKIGLKKIKNETYFQNILMHGSIALENSELIIKNGNQELQLNLIDDYLFFNTNTLNYIPQYKEIVFVGYGIVAPEYDYNDYLSIDVENKVVIFLDGEPNSNDPSFFNGLNPTIYSNVEVKNRIAFSRGAIASILIPINSYKNWEAVQNEFSRENISLSYFTNLNLNIIINPINLDFIFSGSKRNIKQIIEDHLKNKIESFELKSELKFKGVFKERTFYARNVIGILEGKDSKLKDEYVIVSAHYDHLGIGKAIKGDSIYNGAFDNAIGVSVMLSIADFIISKNLFNKRSIIFIATTAEEYGLLGSKFYVDNPIVPLHKTIANVNIDGIAINSDFESLIGIGAELSSIKNVLNDLAKTKNLYIENIPDEFLKYGAFEYSDQYSFAQAGIPSILIYEGTKNKNKTEKEVIKSFIDYMTEYYHTPFDDLNQKIDYRAAEQHANFLIDFILELSNVKNNPEWNYGVPFNYQRLKSINEKK